MEVLLYEYPMAAGVVATLAGGLFPHGIIHSGIVIENREWFFSRLGICFVEPPGTTVLGQPGRIVNLGETDVSSQDLRRFMRALAQSLFRITTSWTTIAGCKCELAKMCTTTVTGCSLQVATG
jgi:hypothetical protein